MKDGEATVSDAASIRAELLDEAKLVVTADRNVQYGGPEESFQRIAKHWSIHLDMEIRPHDVAIMLALVKVARIHASPDKWDHWVDGAGYFACGAEVRPIQRTVSAALDEDCGCN